jgi:ABC-type dipeptide/oligopeptide/nickel transport systems, permease components
MFVAALGPSAPTLIIVIGLVFGAAHLPDGADRRPPGTGPRLHRRRPAPRREQRSHHVRRDTAERDRAILVEFTVRLGYAIFTIATLSFLGFGIQPPTPDWGGHIANSYQYLGAGYWWEVLFAALAIASLVVAINLIADSIEAVVIQ